MRAPASSLVGVLGVLVAGSVVASLAASCAPFGADSSPALDAGAVDGTALPEGGDAQVVGLRYADVVLADKPTAYLRFGDGAGTAFDEVKGASATVAGQPNVRAPGAIAGDPDTSFDFDGSEGVITTANLPELSATNPFTLEAWISIKVATAAFRHAFQIGDSTGGTRNSVGVYINTDANEGLVFERWVNGGKSVARVAPPSANVWHHVVSTFSGTVLSLYVDGTLVSTKADARAQSATLTSPLFIGARAAGAAGSVWPGGMDEVAVYATALSEERIRAHYVAGTTGP